MEPHELIAKLEALGLEQDALTVQLIEALKEREAIKGDIEQLEQRRLEQQGAVSSFVVEAAFALQDMAGSHRRKSLLRRMGFGAVQ